MRKVRSFGVVLVVALAAALVPASALAQYAGGGGSQPSGSTSSQPATTSAQPAAPAQATAAPAQPAAAPTQAAASTPAAGGAAGKSVSIVDFAFQPANLTISPGDTVTWTNSGPSTHTSTSDSGAWDSGRLAPGQTFSHTFATAGTFAYHCAIHPQMHGTITVAGAASNAQAASTPSGAAQPAATPTALPKTGGLPAEALPIVGLGALVLLGTGRLFRRR